MISLLLQTVVVELAERITRVPLQTFRVSRHSCFVLLWKALFEKSGLGTLNEACSYVFLIVSRLKHFLIFASHIKHWNKKLIWRGKLSSQDTPVFYHCSL